MEEAKGRIDAGLEVGEGEGSMRDPEMRDNHVVLRWKNKGERVEK